MKVVLKAFIINSIGLWLLSRLLKGFVVNDPKSLLTAALVLALASLTIRPIIKLITLPINVLTLGLFSGIANLVTLYLTIKITPGLSVIATNFPGLIIGNFTIPQTIIPKLGTLVIASTFFSLIYNISHNTINWLFDN